MKMNKLAFYVPVLALGATVSSQAAVDAQLSSALTDLETFALAGLAIAIGVAIVKAGYRVFSKLFGKIG